MRRVPASTDDVSRVYEPLHPVHVVSMLSRITCLMIAGISI